MPQSSTSKLRKVRLSDNELFQRVQRVMVPDRPVNLHKLSPKRGWKRVRSGVAQGMEMHFRVRQESITVAPFQTRQCQVVVGGEIHVRPSELQSLLRAPTESESNALFRALYGSQFIYSSLLHHAVPTSESSDGQELMVRTASFTHKRHLNPFTNWNSSHQAKNEQSCYIELLTPTSQGFKMAFCTLDAAEVTAGKAPPERVVALHPMTGWLTAEASPTNTESLQFTFQAAFLGNTPGGCDSKIAQSRLLSMAKGFSHLEKLLRRRQPGKLRQAMVYPFRALGIVGSEDDGSGGAHHIWHCIACTRSFLPTLHKSWRRCDLCAYRVCAESPCCTREQVAIYSRYVAPLMVCARCRECINECDSVNGERGNPEGNTGVGDVRYTGISLRLEGDFEPEFEVEPSYRTSGRWGLRSSWRSSEGLQRKRGTQSDPPPMLGLPFFSSGDDSSSSGTEFVSRVPTKQS